MLLKINISFFIFLINIFNANFLAQRLVIGNQIINQIITVKTKST